MPCSCKTKNNKVVINSTANREFDIIAYKEAANSKQSIIQIVSDSYDFSSTTQPTELCYNCIRKHLSVAYTLLEENNPDAFLIALGQILCASLHLTTANKGLCNEMQNKVLQAMRGNKDHILYDLLNWIQNIQSITSTVQLVKPSPFQANLIGLLQAYGLLFVEVSYQQLNKNWATAYLIKGAIAKFSADHDLQEFQNVRRIWKMIQSMTLYDKTYDDAKEKLKEQLQKQWEKYNNP